MKVIISSLALCAMLLSMPVHVYAGILVEVIHSDAFPLTGIDELVEHGIVVKTYNLDDGKRWTANLATGLPLNQEQAKAVIEQRFQQQGMASVQNQVMQAFQARITTIQYGITRYPAIVFEHGQAVVYGVTDLTRALHLYQEWRRQNP